MNSSVFLTEFSTNPAFIFPSSVKDDTLRKFDAEKIAGDNSLKGEFIRLVLADETIDGEKKQKVISVGLKALSDRELDI